MALNTASAIFALGVAAILAQAADGWAAAIMVRGPAGRTTPRQLVFTLTPPVIGDVLVRASVQQLSLIR